jgi:hypothetical protein
VAVNTTGKPEPVGAHVTVIQLDRQVIAKIVNDGGVKIARFN